MPNSAQPEELPSQGNIGVSSEARSWGGRLELPLQRLDAFFGKSTLGFGVVTALLATYGLIRITQATPAGMGLGGDSYSYVTAADNLAAGIGFGRLNGRGELIPTTHYPPFYPISLAALQVIGVDKLESARWINLISFVALIFLASVVIRQETRSNYPGYAAGAILVTAPVIFNASIWALSEPLYLALGLEGLWSLSRYLQLGNRWLFLLAALLVGLGYSTRYVGISLVGTAVLILLLQKRSWKHRLIDAGLVLVIAVTPVVLWWIRNATLTGNFANRRIIWHPVTYTHLKALALRVLQWFVPKELITSGLQALALIMIGIVIIAVLLLRMRRADRLAVHFQRDGILTMLVIYTGLYVLAVGASLSLFDPFTPIDNRIFVPVYISLVLIATVIMWETWRLHGPFVRVAIMLGFVFILAWNALVQSRQADSYSMYGLGNASFSISDSQTVAAVRDLPSVPIVSNGISRLYFWADRNVFALPWLIDLETNEPDPAYQANLQIMRDRLCLENGYLVLFAPENLVPEQAPLDDLIEGLALIGDYPDGEIYFCG